MAVIFARGSCQDRSRSRPIMADSIEHTRTRWSPLPPDNAVGWTPYAWLIYLATLFVEPAVTHAGAVAWSLTIVGAMAFLFAYFRAYWTRRDRERLGLSLFQFLLGLAFSFWNAGAAVLFV